MESVFHRVDLIEIHSRFVYWSLVVYWVLMALAVIQTVSITVYERKNRFLPAAGKVNMDEGPQVLYDGIELNTRIVKT